MVSTGGGGFVVNDHLQCLAQRNFHTGLILILAINQLNAQNLVL